MLSLLLPKKYVFSKLNYFFQYKFNNEPVDIVIVHNGQLRLHIHLITSDLIFIFFHILVSSEMLFLKRIIAIYGRVCEFTPKPWGFLFRFTNDSLELIEAFLFATDPLSSLLLYKLQVWRTVYNFWICCRASLVLGLTQRWQPSWLHSKCARVAHSNAACCLQNLKTATECCASVLMTGNAKCSNFFFHFRGHILTCS